jgi:hypothetical protein
LYVSHAEDPSPTLRLCSPHAMLRSPLYVARPPIAPECFFLLPCTYCASAAAAFPLSLPVPPPPTPSHSFLHPLRLLFNRVAPVAAATPAMRPRLSIKRTRLCFVSCTICLPRAGKRFPNGSKPLSWPRIKGGSLCIGEACAGACAGACAVVLRYVELYWLGLEQGR